jgi:hypothetical protein
MVAEVVKVTALVSMKSYWLVDAANTEKVYVPTGAPLNLTTNDLVASSALMT